MCSRSVDEKAVRRSNNFSTTLIKSTLQVFTTRKGSGGDTKIIKIYRPLISRLQQLLIFKYGAAIMTKMRVQLAKNVRFIMLENMLLRTEDEPLDDLHKNACNNKQVDIVVCI